ncbi:SIR2 family NAD-dependent protein deacylase [Coralloluteibacterium thermophilus]|uniref:NAD-dependent protein deacylase n=1 Tax=Coralloluteibacterium thermophilum TaxID=2707049 RepID=A0ABV9NN70_9GAMM
MRITVLSGAGMSAESGIPTFRDALTGLWADYDPARLATPEAFEADPALVWGWYRWRAAAVARAQPNAGHLGIAALARAGHRVRVVTQNVDDLHERAGSTGVVHLHGRLLASRCFACGLRPQPDPMREGLAGLHAQAPCAPPACAACGGPLRPDVVWFGEALPEDAWRAAVEAVADCELLVVVGTSGLVYPAAALPQQARRPRTRVIAINPAAPEAPWQFDEVWRLPASEGVERLLRELA